MAKIYLILGGARSGKSSFGEELVASLSGKTGYLATAKITDIEMEKRVNIHRKRRPADWITFEIEKSDPDTEEIDSIISSMESNGIKTAIIDCITNLMFRLIDNYKLDDMEIIENRLEEKIEKEVLDFFGYFLQKISKTEMNIIIISNEIGMGVVPAFPLGRIFRDLMGMINKNIAKVSDEVYLVTAGIKQRLK
ncbi:MAG: bifunctional adenosylcobinamide kinase/adenosylcobinamide-phosphate guanylyltransferase [Actinobacteria bacterium]|nr:bifunctional adenosylcobinamide kinase/adenosylcobinamide-phosphate guanylyltransferase [Actinomycetota bacterium]